MFNTFSTEHPDLNLGIAQTFVLDSIPDLFNYARQVMADIIPVLYDAGMSVISWLINIILAFVISCYLMWGKQQLLTSLKRVIFAIFNEKMQTALFTPPRNVTVFSASLLSAKRLTP